MAFYPGELPGHGVDINEAEAAKYPYKRACLPVNRLEDGSLGLVTILGGECIGAFIYPATH